MRSQRTRTRAAALVLALLAVGSLLAPTPAAADVPPPGWGVDEPGVDGLGINYGGVGVVPADWHPEDLAALDGIGIDRVRTTFYRATINPSAGLFKWATVDRLMAEIADNDQRMLAIPAYGQTWGEGGTNPPDTDPERADFADYTEAIVDRYRPGGAYWVGCDGTPPTYAVGTDDPGQAWHCPAAASSDEDDVNDLDSSALLEVEVWNEPQYNWNSTAGTHAAAEYAALVRRVEDEIDGFPMHIDIAIAADWVHAPGERTLSPAPGNGEGFFERLLAADDDLVDVIDAVSLHPYSDWGNDDVFGPMEDGGQSYGFEFRDRIEILLDQLDAEGGGWDDLPVWITEIGWSLGGAPNGWATEAEQAEWSHQAVVQAFREDDYEGRVDRVYLYSGSRNAAANPRTLPSTDDQAYFGTFESDGDPQPVFDSLEFLLTATGQYAFTDTFADTPFVEDIAWLSEEDITQGYDEDNTFRPSTTITRQAVAAMFYRAAGSPSFSPGSPDFSDVSAGHPFFLEIEWASNQGIVNGYSDGTFRPGNDVTRQAAVAFFYQQAGSPAFSPGAQDFSDVGSGNPFRKAIEWAAAQDTVEGYPDGTFRPSNPVSRQAEAAFFRRHFT
jgi:hypothetical protein